MKLAAIVVTFFPANEEFVKNTESYIDFVERLYVWDNTPIERRSERNDGIAAIKEKYPGKVFCFENDKNVGLGYAYNKGIKRAKQDGFTHLMTMDQDSSFQQFEGFKQNVEKAANTEEIDKIGVYMPLRNQPQVYSDWEPYGQKGLLQSGAIFPLRLFDKVGLFREDFFIDGIDEEMGYRLRKYGYRVTVYSGCNMIHQIGSGHRASFCGIRFSIPDYAPMRGFYILRNKTFLRKEYAYEFGIDWHYWFVKQYIFKYIVKIIFGEKNKMEKISAIGKGLYYGLFSIHKPYKPNQFEDAL